MKHPFYVLINISMLPARPACIKGNVTNSDPKRIHIFELAFPQPNLVAQALYFGIVLNRHHILHLIQVFS